MTTALACLTLLAWLGMGEALRAQSDNWNVNSSGNWETGSNWSAGSEPISADTVEVSASGGPFTVSINAPGAVASSLTVNGSSSANPVPNMSVTISNGASLNVGGTIFMTDDGAMNVLKGGSLTANEVNLGSAASGFYNYLNVYGGSTINVATIQIAGDGYLQFLGSGNVTLSSTIVGAGGGSGAGNVLQDSTGTTILTGNSSGFVGSTTVEQGTLEIDNISGTYGSGSSTTTINGGILRGSGTLGGNVTVNSGGILAAGSASTPGTLTFTGNLLLNSGSETLLRVGSSASDEIVLNGTATLGGTLLVAPIAGSAPRVGQTYTLVNAPGGLSSTFNSYTNTLGNALNFTFSYTATSAIITSSQGSFLPFAHDPTQTTVARLLDSVNSDPRIASVLNYLDGLSGSALPAALQSIAPLATTAMAPIAFNDGRAHFRTLDTRLANVRDGSTGLDLSQVNFNEQDIPLTSLMAGTDGAILTSKPFIPDPSNKWGFFAAANGDFGDIDGQNGAPDSDYYGGGASLGADYRLTPSLSVGFAGAYNKDKDTFTDGSIISADTVRYGPYATWHDKSGNWVDAQVGGAYHWYDSNRASLGGTASGATTGTEFDASTKYGHDFKVGNWILTPSFGFDYLELDTDAFSENGSLTPLTITSQETQSLQSALGGTASYHFKWKSIQWAPYVSAGWNHEFLDTGAAATARFTSGAGDLFTVNGYNVGRESATFGTGIQAVLTKALTASVGYSGQANSDFLDNAFQASVRIGF